MRTRKFGFIFAFCLALILIFTGIAGSCAQPAATTPTATTPTATSPTATTPTATTPTATTPTATSPTEPTTTTGPKAGGTLRVILTEAPEGSIGVPANIRGMAGTFVKNLVIEPLLIQDWEGNVKPCLAESFEWSDDSTDLTLHLRQGVKFHDGTPFNADAVKWNWDLATEKQMVGTAEVESLEIVDDYTVVFHLKEFKNAWIDNMTSSAQSSTSLMISPTAYEANGEEWADWNPVGTGPYKFVSYIDGQSEELTKFDDYWGDTYLDGIEFKIIADFVTAEIAFQAGEGDCIMVTGHDRDLAHDLLPKIEGSWSLMSPGLANVIMPPSNRPDSPFSKLEVREAVEYAVDKQKICDSIYYGMAISKPSVAFSFQLPYDPNFQGREYDPEKAMQLLADAGYPDGLDTTLYCQEQNYGRDIDAVQAMLLDVGIRAKLEVITVGKWIEMETNGWDDGLLMTFLGPETFRAQVERDWVNPTGPNWFNGIWWQTMKRPDELNALTEAYFGISDIAQEKAQGQEIVQLIYDQALCLPLWEAQSVMVLQPYVKCTDPDYGAFSGGLRERPITSYWLDK